MSDKNVIPPRPFSFFNELLLNNETKVKDLQQSVARDFVAGYKPNLVNLIDSILSWTLPPSNKPKTRCINLPIFYKCKVFFGVNLSMIRNFDTPITKVITPEDYVKNASPLFQELSRIDKYVLLVHGFNVSQIQSACEFPLFEKLQESFGVSVLDTCKVALQDSQNWKKHFMYPEMSEKLTDSGMRKYADLIIDVLSSNEVFNAALAQATK
jgi:hypothetical protein